MRLWHKELISVLPSKMLVSQWRELSAIVGSINKNGTPNHRLVNILMDFSKDEFLYYSKLIYDEMLFRNMKPNDSVYKKIKEYCGKEKSQIKFEKLYNTWHNERYLKQCYYNLQEKYDREIITKEEWNKITSKIKI